MRVILAIRALNVGGAERQLLEIVKNFDRNRFDVVVVTMYAGAQDRVVADSEGVRLVNLQKKSRYEIVRFFWRFALLIRRLKPDVIYAFMLDMNVIALTAAKLSLQRSKIVWGIFGSEPVFSEGPAFLRPAFCLQRVLEPAVDLILSDSKRGLEFLCKFGFRLRNSEVIFSGTDMHRFCRNDQYRREFRRRHKLGDGNVAIGICSRLVAMKGYPVLAQAARKILAEFGHVVFFAIGYGDDSIREQCDRILSDQAARFVWLGKQQSPEQFLSGWDIYCSSSVYGEGFSNSIIEAMACELPCVATDVGDAKSQLHGNGYVVPPGDSEAVYAALRRMILNENRTQLGKLARQRVETNFTAITMVRKTEHALAELCSEQRL